MNVRRSLRAGLTTVTMRSMVRAMAMTGDPVAMVLGRTALADPYPHYERIRAHGEVSKHFVGLYLTAGHGTGKSVLRDPRFGVEPAVDHVGVDWNLDPGDEHRLIHPMEQSILTMNPPGHTRLRHLVAPWFTPAALREFTPRVHQIVEDTLDEVSGHAQFDLMDRFAARVPIRVISALFDIPEAEQARFVRWGSVLTGTLDGIRTLAERRAVHDTVAELTGYLTGLVARRRTGQGADMVSKLARSELGQTQDGVRDLVGLIGLLLVAGFETTINVIGSGALELMRDPALRAALLDDPGLAAPIVEETMRLEPPAQFTLRKALQPVPVAGRDLPAGAMLVVLIAGANRDPSVFPAPSRFDHTRGNVRDHLAFSGGAHYCLGAGLARITAAAALRALFQRLPSLTQAAPARYKRTRNIRGCSTIPVQHTSPTTGRNRPAAASGNRHNEVLEY
jgi:cytochrome P450